MKNQNWKKTYFTAVFASLLIFGQILYFLAFIFYDPAIEGGVFLAANDLSTIGLGAPSNKLTPQYQAGWAGPYLIFSSLPMFAENTIQNWMRELDFLTLLVGFGIMISWGMVYGLLSRHYQLEHLLADFKQKEADYKDALLDQKMILLRTQIHPHFLSNSMSVIGAYILEQTPIQAYQYLQDFSHLMRDVLEKATEPFLSLQEEVHFLESFLRNLALMLPENKLNWRFLVDPQLDDQQILIPTMILQPLVENAVEHGIKPKEGEGKVTISFTKKEDYLLCTVEDDGVGRFHKHASLRPGHSSMALTITKQRLQLIAGDHPSAYTLKTYDLVDDEGGAQGTKVVVKLPLINV